MDGGLVFFLFFGAVLAIFLVSENYREKYFKEAENKPSMNTNNWEQHQRRLDKFGESKFRDTHIMLALKVGFITLHTEEQKFIANKKFAINLLRPNLLRD